MEPMIDRIGGEEKVHLLVNHFYDLIETLPQRISEICLTDDRVEWVRVTVHKPDAPIEATFSDVALTIHRSRL